MTDSARREIVPRESVLTNDDKGKFSGELYIMADSVQWLSQSDDSARSAEVAYQRELSVTVF